MFKKVADNKTRINVKVCDELIKACENKLKINSIIVGCYNDDDTRNYVKFFMGLGEYSGCEIEWEKDNVVSINKFFYSDHGGIADYKLSGNVKLENLEYPFKAEENEPENKEEEEEEGEEREKC